MQEDSFDHIFTDRKIIPLVLLFGITSDTRGMLFYQTVILRTDLSTLMTDSYIHKDVLLSRVLHILHQKPNITPCLCM